MIHKEAWFHRVAIPYENVQELARRGDFDALRELAVLYERTGRVPQLEPALWRLRYSKLLEAAEKDPVFIPFVWVALKHFDLPELPQVPHAWIQKIPRGYDPVVDVTVSTLPDTHEEDAVAEIESGPVWGGYRFSLRLPLRRFFAWLRKYGARIDDDSPVYPILFADVDAIIDLFRGGPSLEDLVGVEGKILHYPWKSVRQIMLWSQGRP